MLELKQCNATALELISLPFEAEIRRIIAWLNTSGKPVLTKYLQTLGIHKEVLVSLHKFGINEVSFCLHLH